MIDYKKYIQVLEILKDRMVNNGDNFDVPESLEQKASAICELFDTKQVITGNNIYNGTPKLYELKTFTDGGTVPLNLNRVTC